MSRDKHATLGESNCRWRSLMSLPRDEKWEQREVVLWPGSCPLPFIQAWHTYLRVHPFQPSILGCRMEDVQGKTLASFDHTVHKTEESKHHFQASTSHLPWLAAIFGFAGAFQVGLVKLSEGVRFTDYPLSNTSPQLHDWCLGMFAFWSWTLIFLWLQQAHSPWESYI